MTIQVFIVDVSTETGRAGRLALGSAAVRLEPFPVYATTEAGVTELSTALGSAAVFTQEASDDLLPALRKAYRESLAEECRRLARKCLNDIRFTARFQSELRRRLARVGSVAPSLPAKLTPMLDKLDTLNPADDRERVASRYTALAQKLSSL